MRCTQDWRFTAKTCDGHKDKQTESKKEEGGNTHVRDERVADKGGGFLSGGEKSFPAAAAVAVAGS